MVRIVTVTAGFEPPLDEVYALVEIASSGATYFTGSENDAQSGVFRVNNDAPDIVNVIDEARAWAESNGASVVYVVRPPGFAR